MNITYTPMGINVNTRIVSITYNPFYRYTVQIEVGDYVPNLMTSTATKLDRIKQEFRAADPQLIPVTSERHPTTGIMPTSDQTQSPSEAPSHPNSASSARLPS